MRYLSRREFLLSAAAVPLALAACGGVSEPQVGSARLRLQARPRSRDTLTGNDVLLGEGARRAYIRVPATYSATAPTPLIIALHGAGGRGDTFSAAFASRTDQMGAIMLAPNSLGQTWDALTDDFGPDITFINDVLDQTFDRCNIDASRIAFLGFSDGGSYAISLAIANGDQIAGTLAFSPGFFVVDEPQGAPPYFISHGTSDGVLPIDQTSRIVVPALRARGSLVTYVEFDGGHSIPADIANQAFAWLQSPPTTLPR